MAIIFFLNFFLPVPLAEFSQLPSSQVLSRGLDRSPSPPESSFLAPSAPLPLLLLPAKHYRDVPAQLLVLSAACTRGPGRALGAWALEGSLQPCPAGAV